LDFAPAGESLWRARTRIDTTPVDVDLVRWGDGAELTVRPTRRPYFTWSARREERYFDEALALVERVADSVTRRPSLVTYGHEGVSRGRQQEGLRLSA
jgi:hypothetical protein